MALLFVQNNGYEDYSFGLVHGYYYIHIRINMNSKIIISNFSLLISMMGLGGALNGISNRKEVKESARRIFAPIGS